MGNELTRSHQPYFVRQISDSSGIDEATIEGFYSSFEKECPSGLMTPEDFSTLYSKVMCCQVLIGYLQVNGRIKEYGCGGVYKYTIHSVHV